MKLAYEAPSYGCNLKPESAPTLSDNYLDWSADSSSTTVSYYVEDTCGKLNNEKRCDYNEN